MIAVSNKMAASLFNNFAAYTSYQLAMVDNSTQEEMFELTRDEYVALKLKLAELRGIPEPAKVAEVAA